jgi:hypothetical protein
MLLVPATGAAARVIEREPFSDTGSGEETICGQDFHSECSTSGLFMLKKRGQEKTPYLSIKYRNRDMHTDDEGNGFIIQGNGLYKHLRITHVRGTIHRFVAIEAGQPCSVRALDGTVVLHDRGLSSQSS